MTFALFDEAIALSMFLHLFKGGMLFREQNCFLCAKKATFCIVVQWFLIKYVIFALRNACTYASVLRPMSNLKTINML